MSNTKETCVELYDGYDVRHDTLCYVPSDVGMVVGDSVIVDPSLWYQRNYVDDSEGGHTNVVDIVDVDNIHDSIHHVVHSSANEVSIDEAQVCEVKEKEVEVEVDPRDDKIRAKVIINDVVYDPPGTDTDNESISFRLDSNSYVSLDQLYVRVGKRKVRLSGTSIGEQDWVVTDNFRFPNSRITCVAIMQYDYDHVYDEWCYDPDDDSDDYLLFGDDE